MPFARLQLQPGVNLERTQTLNEGGVYRSQLIRWFGSLPQKLGGWQQLLGVPKFVGTCRGLLGWGDFAGNAYLAIGTEQRLAVLSGGAMQDITPVVSVTNPAVAFSTTTGSASVTITDAGSPAVSIGDWIYLATQVSVGGLVLYQYLRVDNVIDSSHYSVTASAPATATVAAGGAVPVFTTTTGSGTVTVTLANHGLSVNSLFMVEVSTTVSGIVIAGNFSVDTVPDAGHFTITGSTVASGPASAAENGGNARIQYLLPSGYAVNTPLAGWGVGDWGAGDWGTGGTGASIAFLRQWSLDHWGQDLIANPTDGAIYYWPPASASVAQPLGGTSPTKNHGVIMLSQQQILLSFGAEVGGTQYPTLLRWCDSGNRPDWVASATNQAGSFQLPSGSKCVAALAVGLGALVWTDIDLWSIAYQGLPFVLGINRVGVNCECISLRSVVILGNIVVWPSLRAFYSFQGSVQPLRCPVWDFFYETVDFTQKEQIFVALNSLFSEASWIFPIGRDVPLYGVHAGDVGYVKYNFADPSHPWDFGLLDGTAWTDHSPYSDGPIRAQHDGTLQEHEQGRDANGAPLEWSFTTGFFDIAQGTDFSFCDLIIPDVHAEDPILLQICVLATDYPGEDPKVYGPFPFFWPTDRYLNVRIRARQIAFKIGSKDLGSFARLGAFRYRLAPAGRR